MQEIMNHPLGETKMQALIPLAKSVLCSTPLTPSNCLMYSMLVDRDSVRLIWLCIFML